jgi:hypothetical protein
MTGFAKADKVLYYLIQLNLIIVVINLNLWKVSKYPTQEA